VPESPTPLLEINFAQINTLCLGPALLQAAAISPLLSWDKPTAQIYCDSQGISRSEEYGKRSWAVSGIGIAGELM